MTVIITLILIGTVAILLELFLPGGIIGVIGALCLLGAIILTFNEYGLGAGVAVTAGVLVMTTLALYFWMKNFDRLPWIKSLILTETAGKDSSPGKNRELLDKSGETLTALGPSGKALIEGQKLDVMAESGYIDQGTPVIVVHADGSKIVVRKSSS
jgi:membrane-bound serine protease (ClpP class)